MDSHVLSNVRIGGRSDAKKKNSRSKKMKLKREQQRREMDGVLQRAILSYSAREGAESIGEKSSVASLLHKNLKRVILVEEGEERKARTEKK